MGNNNAVDEDQNISQNNIFRTTKYRKNKPEDTTLIINKIHQISKDLWNEYTTLFLNPNFCDNVAIAYQNKLSKLTVTQLRSINKSLNNNSDVNLDVVLTHRTDDNDKFITNQFKNKLIDLFGNNKRVNLSYKLNQIKAIIDGDDDDIFYVNPDIIKMLKNQSGGVSPDEMVYNDISKPPQSNISATPVDDISDIKYLFSDIENEVNNNKSNSEPEPKVEPEPEVKPEVESKVEPEVESEPEVKSEPNVGSKKNENISSWRIYQG